MREILSSETRRGRRLLGVLLAASALAAFLGPAAQAQPFGGSWLALTGPSSSYLNVPSVAALNPSSAITIEGWVNVTDPGGCGNIVGKNYQQAWWVGICGTTLRSYLKGTTSIHDGGTLPVGQWTHFAVVYDGVTRKHYINGEVVLNFADAGSLPATGDPLEIGSDVKYPNHTPTGSINEVRLWNVARTQDQIRSTINVPITTSQTGLVAVWALDSTPNDVVGGHNGTLTGSGAHFMSFAAGPPCAGSTATQLCLQGRFQITTTFRTATPPGPSDGTGHVVVAGSNSGIFWFFSSDNWEVMVKAINGCALNNRYWIYSAATTDRSYRMEVFDTVHFVNKVYFNYAGPPAPAVTDSSAFATCP